MALVIKDRVRQTSTTAGTGTITLSGSVTGYQDFTVIGTGNTTYYTIADQSGSNWEVGLGTWTSPNQLSRDTVYESSNGNALVNFGSNIKDVFVTLPAEGFASPPAIGGTTPAAITGTVVSAKTQIRLPAVVNTGTTWGILQMVDGGDGYDYLNMWTDDGSGPGYELGVSFPGGLSTSKGFSAHGLTSITQDGVFPGYLELRSPDNSGFTRIYASYSNGLNLEFYLPNNAGSNNQVLKTDGSGNLSWTDKFLLGAGTATAGTAPLKFTSGTNLTTAEAGAMEYNGTTLFCTGIAASGRGVVLSPTMVRLNANRNKATNNTTLEAIFDPANDALALAANTLYYFKGMYIITTAASGTAAGVQVGFLFSNAQQDIGYRTLGHLNTTGTGQNTSYNTAATAVTTTVTNTTAATYCIEVEGWFKSNATTGGTITPAFTQSVVGTSAAPIANANSWIMIQPMSSNINATLIAGNWS